MIKPREARGSSTGRHGRTRSGRAPLQEARRRCNLDAMKHAGPAALDELESLLEALRTVDGLKEKSRGVFYRGSKAFLHFHEDPAGLFADVRGAGGDFDRLPVGTAPERSVLLRRLGFEDSPPSSEN